MDGTIQHYAGKVRGGAGLASGTLKEVPRCKPRVAPMGQQKFIPLF